MPFVEAMRTSKTVEWSTPQATFDALNAEHGFTLDVCATPENAKCQAYYTRDEDGLSQPWTGVCWMNPPYGREIRRWVQKAYETAKSGAATVVCLLPARTDTTWWHDYCERGDYSFIRGRLTFGDAAAPAPFPCVVVVFRPETVR